MGAGKLEGNRHSRSNPAWLRRPSSGREGEPLSTATPAPVSSKGGDPMLFDEKWKRSMGIYPQQNERGLLAVLVVVLLAGVVVGALTAPFIFPK